MKKWIIRKPNAENVKKIMQKSDLSHLAAEILVARGFETIERAADFFAGGELSDPFLIKDMPEAAEIINAAVEDGKSICVYGDYDCDGITATVMLFSYLEALGADVSYYIPERSEGYGMSENAVRKLASDGVELIITVDNGISAVKEADLIAELGIDLVITDHHQPSEILPKAAAIVDPHRADCTSPFKDLCGAGVVLKLIAALDGGSYDAAMEQFSELAALGTVADIVKLCGENRLIVQNGLHMLENTENLGISALIDQCKLTESKITSTSIGYMIAPRINAAGRFGSPTLAVKLLLSEDDDEAAELAAELSRLNAARKECEQDILAEIEDIIAENPSILNERVLIFSGNNWNAGVIGIVSARIVEKYSKPSFIISINGDVGTGSARGIAGFSIFKSLTACADLFQRFGGHPGAGGFTICTRNIPAFVKNMAEFTKLTYQIMPTVAITAEKVVLPEDLTVKNIESLNVLEPFGEGNVRPIYAILGARINSVIQLSGGKHTKLLLDYGNTQVTLLMFGTEPDNFALKQGDNGDFMVYLDINDYKNNKEVAAKLVDYRKSGLSQAKYFAAKDAYEGYMRGEGVPEPLRPRIIPSREELVAVYKAVKKVPSAIDNIFMSLVSDSMNYCKMRLCLDIFSELKLVHIDHNQETASLVPTVQKVDLESSIILKELRG